MTNRKLELIVPNKVILISILVYVLICLTFGVYALLFNNVEGAGIIRVVNTIETVAFFSTRGSFILPAWSIATTILCFIVIFANFRKHHDEYKQKDLIIAIKNTALKIILVTSLIFLTEVIIIGGWLALNL